MCRLSRALVLATFTALAAGPAGAQTLTYAQSVAVTAMDTAGPTIRTYRRLRGHVPRLRQPRALHREDGDRAPARDGVVDVGRRADVDLQAPARRDLSRRDAVHRRRGRLPRGAPDRPEGERVEPAPVGPDRLREEGRRRHGGDHYPQALRRASQHAGPRQRRDRQPGGGEEARRQLQAEPGRCRAVHAREVGRGERADPQALRRLLGRQGAVRAPRAQARPRIRPRAWPWSRAARPT